MIDNSNLFNLNDYKKIENETVSDNHVIINEEPKEDSMSDTKYVTKEQFTIHQQKIEYDIQKVKNQLTHKIDSLSSETSNNFDLLRSDMKNMLLEEREEQRKRQTETNRFLIGTIFFSSVGLLVAILSLFF